MQLCAESFCQFTARNAAQAAEEEFAAQDDLSWLRPRILDQSQHRLLFRLREKGRFCP